MSSNTPLNKVNVSNLAIAKILHVVVFLTLIISFNRVASAAELIFVDEGNARDGISERVYAAARFYGINIRLVDTSELRKNTLSRDSSKIRSIGAVIVNVRALHRITPSSLLKTLRDIESSRKAKVPMLITGFGPSAGNLIRTWTGGAVGGVEEVDIPAGAGYQIAKIKNLTFELSGVTFDTKESKLYDVFRITPGGNISSIINIVRTGRSREPFTIFSRSLIDGMDIYFHAGRGAGKRTIGQGDVPRGDNLLEIAPILMFLRHAFGEQCWHVPHLYANLTIDDPWLIEPYGYLDYDRLLKEMKKSNFHTTIAFIPWNFDRGTPEVIKLFLENKDRFSLSIHGNNHDHAEFTGKTAVQYGFLIKQALARMENMARNTGLSFDRVMIFPHEVYQESSLALLKRYNFLATASWSGPKGSANLPDLFASAVSVSTKYEDFPIVKRLWITDSRTPTSSDIAMEMFINGFVLFQAHHLLFNDGIDSFDKYANDVNRIRGDVRWAGLGEFARHLYRERIRDDGDVDVISYSNEITLENTVNRKRVYHVRKEEHLNYPVWNVLVDGHPYGNKFLDNEIVLDLEVLPGQQREIRILYENDYDPSSIDISKKGTKIYLLRIFSDFRDLYASKNVLGMIVINSYYGSGLYHQGLKVPIILFLIIIGSTLLFIRIFRKMRIIRSGRKNEYH